MKKLIQTTTAALVAVIIAIGAIVIMRTLNHLPPPFTGIAEVNIQLDEAKLAANLAAAIRFKTVSYQASKGKQNQEFSGFIDWVLTTYPQVNKTLQLQLVNQSMLYKWQGSHVALKPILLTGHYDVVPVIPGSETKWQQPPFSGNIVDGVIWGRGALDDKSGVVGILQAVTYLLEQGFQPQRTVYLSFGHDEEIGGRNGAGTITALLKEQGVQLAWSLDEGSFVFDGIFPGLDALMASINVAEKGSITLDIVATAPGGHSSMPPQNNAVSDLAKAITKLQDNPLPGELGGLSTEMFDNVSRYMPFTMRGLFANQWLFGPIIDKQLSASVTTNAMLRTTTAPTMLSGSVKTNVLPIEAIATVNFRIHPRDNKQSIEDYVTALVASDTISVRARGGINASAVSDWNAKGYADIAKSMREIYGDIAVAPGLMIAGSDSKHYGQIADNAYRFNPFVLASDDLTGFHGTNEKISAANFAKGARGYIQIIRNGSEE